MSINSLTPDELCLLQKLGRLCEVHTRNAVRCLSTEKVGPSQVHGDLARSYSRQAFALARRVLARPAG